MPAARVLFDSIGYRVGDDTVFAPQGSIVDLPEFELERLLELGAVEVVSGRPRTKTSGSARVISPGSDKAE